MTRYGGYLGNKEQTLQTPTTTTSTLTRVPLRLAAQATSSTASDARRFIDTDELRTSEAAEGVLVARGSPINSSNTDRPPRATGSGCKNKRLDFDYEFNLRSTTTAQLS